mgnify:CR=1 FL=1|tara:strand:- start:5088 stop:5840 length:753 start_codon:yes stop_codon:yes gene_type:complete
MKTVTDATEAVLVSGPRPHLLFGGRKYPLEVKHSTRAARIRLRIDPKRGIVLHLPPRVSVVAGLSFIEKEIDWVVANLDRLPEAVPFCDGALLPIMGTPHRITHAPDRRGVVWMEAGRIYVTGREEHLPRRVRDWVRKMAKTEISRRAEAYATRIGKSYKGITLRDQASRWGSCSSTGQLNFSWRLLLMPEEVMDYIVAHEIAHLRHMNHSPAFWRLVDMLHPRVPAARKWLKINGAELHKYGADIQEGV